MEGRAPSIVQLLCDLSEASDEVFRVAAMGHECCDNLRTLTEMEAVGPGPRPHSITCQACDADHSAPIEFDEQAQCYMHFCPEAGRVTVDNADLATLRFDPEWLVDWLVAELPVASPARRRAIVPKCAWHLGDTKCGSTSVTAVFARRLGGQSALNQLAAELRSVHPADKGLVITTSLSVGCTVPLPNGYEFIHLPDLVLPQPDGIAMDLNRLGSWIKRMPSRSGKGAPTRSGRPSQGSTVAEIFKLRRSQGLPVVTFSAEARAIVGDWKHHAPDQDPPAVDTVRSQVSHLFKEAVTESE